MNFDEIKDVKPVRKGEVIDKSEDGENYIIKLAEDKIYEVAPIAFYVWNMCDGEKTVSQIIEEISKEANIESSQIRDPIVTVLEQLQEASLISI
ncbi:MAG: PqqD family protein [Candidatus Aramenus sp.]|nr:PqqD family protein [Candidatus Aramenus sp.]